MVGSYVNMSDSCSTVRILVVQCCDVVRPCLCVIPPQPRRPPRTPRSSAGQATSLLLRSHIVKRVARGLSNRIVYVLVVLSAFLTTAQSFTSALSLATLRCHLVVYGRSAYLSHPVHPASTYSRHCAVLTDATHTSPHASRSNYSIALRPTVSEIVPVHRSSLFLLALSHLLPTNLPQTLSILLLDPSPSLLLCHIIDWVLFLYAWPRPAPLVVPAPVPTSHLPIL